MSPLNLKHRSLRRQQRSSRGKGKPNCSVAVISLKKRALLCPLRQRGLRAPVAAADSTSEESLPRDNTSEEWTEEKGPFWANPSIRWTVKERDVSVPEHKHKVGSVFDPQSNSWVVKYDPPWFSGIPREEFKCDVCDQPGHLGAGCSLLFDYPPGSPPFNTEDYQVVCECGSNEIIPGRRSCIRCQPNSRVRVASKYPLPLIEYEDEYPDPASYSPIFGDM